MTRHAPPQIAWFSSPDRNYSRLELPDASTDVLPGVPWGSVSNLLTPAFWKYHSIARRKCGRYQSHALGRSLIEEISLCLLGGHGMPAELGLAAFVRLRDEQLLFPDVTSAAIERALTRPLQIAGRRRRYRFPRQKARYLSKALKFVAQSPLPHGERDLRNHLTNVDGIGLKTASWIVRNRYGSDHVAIIDVHILRAGIAAGIFSPRADPSRHYLDLEHRFLSFCRALDEPASQLDALMWDFMRRLTPILRRRRQSEREQPYEKENNASNSHFLHRPKQPSPRAT